MLRVYTCLTTEHDLRLVVLAGAICLFACLSTISLLHRARSGERRGRFVWIAAAAMASGFGIWSTHFIAMLAYRPGLPVEYDVGLTGLSLFVVIVVSAAGYGIAFVRPRRLTAPLGGALVGAGIATMHYVGMAALQFAGYVTMAADLVTASIVLAMLFGAAAIAWALRGAGALNVFGAGAVLSLGVLALHFTAMGAFGLVATQTNVPHPLAMSPVVLSIAVAGVTISLLGISLFGAVADRRMKETGRRLAVAVNNMTQGLVMFDAQERMVVCNERYMQMYRLSPDVVKPGCTLRDVIANRIASGSLEADPREYRDRLLDAMTHARTISWIVDTPDGRAISVINTPTAGGDWVATHEDITERRRAEQELERTKQFLDTVIENVPVTITVKELPDRRYVLINRAGEQYFGVPRERMLGKTVDEVFNATTAAKIDGYDSTALAGGRDVTFDVHPVTTPGGETRVVSSRLLPVAGPEGDFKYLVSVVEDMTERKRAEARIEHLAYHDSLTDLPNRTAFNDTLATTLAHAAADGSGFALLNIDLDRFKEINDVFGHATGDAALGVFAERLRQADSTAFAARLGGDEFAVIIAGGELPQSAEQLAAKIMEAAQEPIDLDGVLLRMNASIGVAIYPSDGADVEALIANADAALYRAKSEGRGVMRFFSPAMDAQLRDRRTLQHEMRTALERGQLELHYQPQAQVDGEITGFEALLRWHHPTRGMVAPGAFIPLAEESGLIVPIGEWVLRETCREAASWSRPLRIAVNLSPVQFQQGDLAGFVHGVLLETGLSPDRLELEITEGVLIADFSRAVAILRRLKAMGVRIAMDDFGTGYSSLSYLQSFPFDKIKIDRAFISNLDSSPQSAAIVRAVIGLGRGLNLPIIAEGVETQSQLAFLSREECDEVQGYLVGRPSPIAVFADIVAPERAPHGAERVA